MGEEEEDGKEKNEVFSPCMKKTICFVSRVVFLTGLGRWVLLFFFNNFRCVKTENDASL